MASGALAHLASSFWHLALLLIHET